MKLRGFLDQALRRAQSTGLSMTRYPAPGFQELSYTMQATGSGLCHPESSFLVPHSEEILNEGNVVTLEPGVYLKGLGGMRIEHAYLITGQGFEKLSNHEISL